MGPVCSMSVLDAYESQPFLMTKEPNNGNRHWKIDLEAFIDRDAKALKFFLVEMSTASFYLTQETAMLDGS